jgi:hypothetical protein
MQEEPLYKDEYVTVTRGALRNGGASYPIATIAKVVRPIQDSFEFGGFLVNLGLLVFGLYGITRFSTGWVIGGLFAALLGGFNVWGVFRRHWWISVDFINGREIRIEDLSKERIVNIYVALRLAIDPT